jgi:hypothetical protein
MKLSTPMTIGGARSIFGAEALDARPITFDSRLRSLPAIVRGFYAERSARAVLLLCTLFVGYVGGAVLFWFHSIYLNEGGPAISPWLHWFIDSSAGFLGLFPAVALTLPLTAVLVAQLQNPGRPKIAIVPYALVAGTILAVVTAPAPLLHDIFIGRGTWAAAQITRHWGGHAHHAFGQSPAGTVAFRMTEQAVAASVTYTVVLLLAVLVARALARLTARRPPLRWGDVHHR